MPQARRVRDEGWGVFCLSPLGYENYLRRCFQKEPGEHLKQAVEAWRNEVFQISVRLGVLRSGQILQMDCSWGSPFSLPLSLPRTPTIACMTFYK